MIGIRVLLAGIFVAAIAIRVGDCLKCYVCSNQLSNNDCSQEDHAVECSSVESPDRDRYDVCQTTITKDNAAGDLISKKCAVGPCSLGTNQNAALGLECSSGRCETCCGNDLCNYGTASSTVVSMLLIVACLICCGLRILT